MCWRLWCFIAGHVYCMPAPLLLASTHMSKHALALAENPQVRQSGVLPPGLVPAATKLDADSLEAIAGDAPSATLPRDQLVGAQLADVMVAVGMQPSKGAVRRMIKVGAATLFVCERKAQLAHVARFALSAGHLPQPWAGAIAALCMFCRLVCAALGVRRTRCGTAREQTTPRWRLLVGVAGRRRAGEQ